MDFGNKYLTYLEYKELGGEMSVSPFNVLEYEARKKIDERTQGRLIDFTPIPTQVKMCMYNLINIIEDYLIESSGSRKGIASENIDGYSVSYISASEVQNAVISKAKEIDDIILTYLTGLIINDEHVIYIGVD